ncbi:MAG TPA: hypothetical protein VFZ24_12470 [Longimicrobiales bacterium]
MSFPADRVRSPAAVLGALLLLLFWNRAAAQQPDLPFPLLLERERLDAGNPLAPYHAMLQLEEQYLASPVFRSVYPEIRAMFEEFMGVPLAGVRALSLPALRRVFTNDGNDVPNDLIPQDAIDVIVRRAAGTRAVIWGEEHHLPQTRSLYESLLHGLWDQGYRYLAAEAFTDAVMDTGFTDVDYGSGLYLLDPVFASAVRTALDLGYRLVAYDTSERGPEGEAGFRDRRQAENIIARVFDGDPEARVLVLAGRGHASETTASDGWKPMAAVLKERTGIDPLTVFAPTMSMRQSPEEEHPLYRAATARGLVRRPTIFVNRLNDELVGPEFADAYIFWPRVQVKNGRESWVFELPGRREVRVPFTLPPGPGLVLVQAFRDGRPDRAVPDDQILIHLDSIPGLALRRGVYRIRALRPDGEVIAEQTVTTGDEDVPQHVSAAAALLVERAVDIDRVWPGFWPEPRPYVLTDFERAEQTLLFTPYDPLDGFSRVADDVLPLVLRGRMYVRAGIFSGDYLAGAGRRPDETMPAPVPLAGPDGLENGYSQAEAILHESFHFWQLATWNDAHRRQPADCTPQRYDNIGVDPPADFQDAARREVLILAAAVGAADRRQRSAGAREYLAARLKRLAAADPLFAAVDQRQERREGTAQFAGLAGSLAASHADTSRARAALRDTVASLLADFGRLSDAPGADETQEAAFRAYHTGAAMAVLLDDLGAGDWRGAVQSGAFLDLLLARAVGANEYIRVSEGRATYRTCAAG